MNPINPATLSSWTTRGPLLPIILFGALAAFACKKEVPPPEASASATVSAALPPPAPGSVRVLVTDEGFQPTRVELKKGEKLLFRRTSDNTCAKDVVFPELHIEKHLPLNADVVVELPPTASGELGFQCGMGMYQSKVVVN